MAELVVGTAGHIDHGKTALVAALTGVDCDRLELERQRGMTIELGFAPWRLPSGREVSVVDVPGHERFIRTMAVGARSTDLALLCVAADDGVMPQTEEHAAVLSLLGVRCALVVVTKSDLAPDRAAAVAAAASRLLQTLGIHGSGEVVTSARSGEGLEELEATVDRELERLPAVEERSGPRLHVDRSFTRAGIGTVVTGVLDGGALHRGEQVEVFPSLARGRILELQRRGAVVERADPGGRLALALRGIPTSGVGRGSVVGVPGTILPTSRLDCVLEVPARGASGVRQGSAVEVILGTAAISATVWLAGESALAPGDRGYAQVQLARAAWALPGDRVILRASSPASILAGGAVLDAHPRRHRRWTDAPLDQWAARERALIHGDVAALAVEEASRAEAGVSAAGAAARAGTTVPAAQAALDQATEAGQLVRLGPVYLRAERLDELESRAEILVARHLAARPLEAGMPRSQLLFGLSLTGPGGGDRLLERLERSGRIMSRGGLVATARPAGGPAPAAATRVGSLLQRSGPRPPGAEDLRAAGLTPRVAAYLVRTGEAVQVTPEVLVASSALAQLKDRLGTVLAETPEGLTVAALRDHLGTSRRLLVPFLEQLERERFLERRGDLHRLRREEECLTNG